MSGTILIGTRFVRLCASLGLVGFLATACSTLQPIEPVISPPSHYQGNATVNVEFVHPAMVGLRCAERGAKFLGVPMVNAGACADETLITMSNPCFATNGGWYARTLCHELAHVNGWASNHAGGSLRQQPPIRMASMSPEAIAYAEAEAQRQQQAHTAEGPTAHLTQVAVAADGHDHSAPAVLRGTQAPQKPARSAAKARGQAAVVLETASALP